MPYIYDLEGYLRGGNDEGLQLRPPVSVHKHRRVIRSDRRVRQVGHDLVIIAKAADALVEPLGRGGGGGGGERQGRARLAGRERGALFALLLAILSKCTPR